ncbi:MAG: TIGR02186 family protein [Pseudomonadota bacterium]
MIQIGATLLTRLSIALVLILATDSASHAETVIADLSDSLVEIESNFVGTELTVFGSIERDAATVARQGGYDVVVVVRGPLQTIVTRRKARTAGLWLNRDAITFLNVPAYYAVLSTRGLSLIGDGTVYERFGIGLTALRFLPREGNVPEAVRIAFQSAMIRLKISEGLYREAPTGVTMMSPTLFRSRIELPSNIATGVYSANIFVFGGRSIVGQQQLIFQVRKSGVEAEIFELAHDNPLTYGVLAVLVALAAGWLAGVIFRSS